MFALKDYQTRALTALSQFLSAARSGPVAEAFKQSYLDQGLPPVPYRHYDFGELPYVCLRLPTGGGKTVLASYAVSVAQKAYLEQDYPVVLWLVPTNTIREQTLEALKTVGHPYRQALENEFGLDRLRVFDVGEVTQIRRQDIGRKTLVIVGTLAALRVEDTSGRKVYVHHEDFEPHFVGVADPEQRLERISEKDLQENGLRREDIDKIKASFANLLALHQPLVIMDEAHNARTKLTFDTLKRLHPACIIEFTATPDNSQTSSSNVLYRCSASELKAEHMIKLPIVLTEHKDWQAAVRDAVLTSKKLALEAHKESDFIRPIVLFQAEAKNGAVTVEVLKAHLVEQLHIDEREIAIATGKQRELDGLNLFSRACPIKYIITIEALKEGWDCSFAYVFCSVKDVKSSKDAEQLLGRVLRMPYAKRRNSEALNRAYAHLASPDFSIVAKQLTDKLIDMGFEALEVAENLLQGNPNQKDIFEGEESDPAPQIEPTLRFEMKTKPELPPEAATNVVVTTTPQNTFSVEIKGEVSPETKAQLLKTVAGTQKQQFSAQIELHNQRVIVARVPSQRGEVFAPLPQLCWKQDDFWHLLDSDAFMHWRGEWSLLDYPAELSNFKLAQTEHTFEVDMAGKKLVYRLADQNQAYNLDWVESGYTENDLLFWLEPQVRQIGLIPAQLRAFLTKLIANLTKSQGLPLTGLVRSKYALARAVREQIESYRKQAADKGFQHALFEENNNLETRFDHVCEFSPGYYPARPPFYEGRYQFSKHFYSVIEDLKESGEEFECAKLIDSHPKVKFWIRNLINRDGVAFRLPLAKGWFYPDFVAELVDGRLLVVEYKGKVYATNDDSREKRAVGELWARKSCGKCLFLMAEAKNTQGKGVFQQIDELIGL
ncbi:DEAD/DEAH box helicase family protein [Methylomicrobium sp. Wu6]|uniref:DEAD/DEAH box helicase n=1 Tax=Methylomicrobium sp. Wu6 TaxID=3107928 RepID=UPI002DD63255|nr:DEAD/DEAH box helicase family protein [Methylomicrobium sp. Wu6]MEC4747451.1 DEAD/DEAH box helicase family protein [Methylomicrobium sp. Wu6]